MKIAFATIYDLRDVRRGSGTFHFLAKELERQGHPVDYVGPFEGMEFPLATRFFRRAAVATGRRYRSWQDPFAGRRLGALVTRSLCSVDCDLLLTNDFAVAGYVRTHKPVVLYTDAMFPHRYNEDVNPRLWHLSRMSVRFCQHIRRTGLSQARVSVFPTNWAAEEALKYGVADKMRIAVVPFGANLLAPPEAVLNRRVLGEGLTKRRFRLLFVGKDWIGKGGAIAVESTTELRKRGSDATLDVVGVGPSSGEAAEGVVFHGLIDKSEAAGRERIHQLFMESDALILPTWAEGFGIAAVEAAAYGLPTLAYRSIGISEAVRDGESGVLVPRGSRGEAFAAIVEDWFENPSSYELMAQRARETFDANFSWERIANRLIREIQSRLHGPACSPRIGNAKGLSECRDNARFTE